jgi:hypothetical protein
MFSAVAIQIAATGVSLSDTASGGVDAARAGARRRCTLV